MISTFDASRGSGMIATRHLATGTERSKTPMRSGQKGGAEGEVEGSQELSNRAKFRQINIDQNVLRKIVQGGICLPMGSAVRKAHRGNKDQVEQEKKFKGFSRPPLYTDLAPQLVELIGQGKKDKLTFVAGATVMSSMPPMTLPEVAFCGRSNVGKSSIINALTLSTTARSSDKPGMTQQVELMPCLLPVSSHVVCSSSTSMCFLAV